MYEVVCIILYPYSCNKEEQRSSSNDGTREVIITEGTSFSDEGPDRDMRAFASLYVYTPSACVRSSSIHACACNAQSSYDNTQTGIMQGICAYSLSVCRYKMVRAIKWVDEVKITLLDTPVK